MWTSDADSGGKTCLCISCITWALKWDGPNIYSLLFLKIIFSVGNLTSSRGSRLNLSEATRPLQVEVGGQARRSRSVGPLEVSSASAGRTRREGSAGRKTRTQTRKYARKFPKATTTFRNVGSRLYVGNILRVTNIYKIDRGGHWHWQVGRMPDTDRKEWKIILFQKSEGKD